jgi:putative hemolysin
VEAFADELALGIVVVGITLCSLIIGELVPKRLALLNPETIASFIARPMQGLSVLMFPIVRFLSFVTETVVRLFGSRASSAPAVTEEEIQVLMAQGAQAGIFELHEQRIVSRVFRMDEEQVVALMTRRMDIVYLDLQDSFDASRRTILDNDYSRFVLCDGGIDKIVGIVGTKGLLNDALRGKQVQLQDHAAAPLYVHGSNTITTLLDTLKQHHQHIALVLDEYGQLEGLVTMSDVIEALVGAIGGEGTGDPDIVRRDDTSWLVDGSASIHRMKEAVEIDVDLPREDTGVFHTVGGFAMGHLARIPRTGDCFEAAGYRFEIVDMDKNRVDKLLVTRLRPEDQETPAGNGTP